MLKEMKNIPPAFPQHKVTIKAISNGLCAPSPSKAIAYIMNNWEGIPIVVNKQRERSITITIYCSDEQYKFMKLYFVRDMGRDFLWKD